MIIYNIYGRSSNKLSPIYNKYGRSVIQQIIHNYANWPGRRRASKRPFFSLNSVLYWASIAPVFVTQNRCDDLTEVWKFNEFWYIVRVYQFSETLTKRKP